TGRADARPRRKRSPDTSKPSRPPTNGRFARRAQRARKAVPGIRRPAGRRVHRFAKGCGVLVRAAARTSAAAPRAASRPLHPRTVLELFARHRTVLVRVPVLEDLAEHVAAARAARARTARAACARTSARHVL